MTYFNAKIFTLLFLGQPGTPGLPGLPGQSFGGKPQPSVDYGKPSASAGYPGSPGNIQFTKIINEYYENLPNIIFMLSKRFKLTEKRKKKINLNKIFFDT